MSVRQQIIDAVRARLATIRIANGYATDIGANVLEWQTTPIPVESLPAVCMRDTETEIEAWTMRERDNRVALVIEAVGQDISPALARSYLEDIYRAIGADETWGGLALLTEPAGDSIELMINDEGVGRATVRITIEYQAGKWEF